MYAPDICRCFGGASPLGLRSLYTYLLVAKWALAPRPVPVAVAELWDPPGIRLGSFCDNFGLLLRSFWDHLGIIDRVIFIVLLYPCLVLLINSATL